MRLGYYLAHEEAFDWQLSAQGFCRDYVFLTDFWGTYGKIFENPHRDGQAAVFAAVLKGEEDATSDDQRINRYQ